jgi:hypothetical protein
MRASGARVRGTEWVFPLLVAAALVLIASMPYAVAYRTDPESGRFMGVIGRDGIDDNNVYLALMRQAADGRLLFTNNFTSEPNPPALFNVAYLALGRFAGATGWRVDAVHRLFGAGSIVLLVLVAYAFIAASIRKPWYRRMALVLACFGMGFLWAARLLSRLIGQPVKTIDSWLVELNLFHAMLVYPHFVFAAALMVASFFLLLKAEREGRLAPALFGGLVGMVLAATHTFEMVVLLPAAVTYVLLQWMATERLPPFRQWIALAMVVGLPVPVLVLNSWTLSHEPMWGNVVNRLDFYTPDLFSVAIGLGASFIIAVLTFDGFLRTDRSGGEQMAKAWLVVALALAYVPRFNWQFHLLNGLQIPLAVLATQGLRRTLFRALLRRRRSRAALRLPRGLQGRPAVLGAAALTIVVCCLSGVNLVRSYCHEAAKVEDPTYLPEDEVQAIEWMDREVPREALVLSAYATGNYIPRLSGQRVFLGEDKLTEAAPSRTAEVEGFFRPQWSDEERLDLLRRFGVNYVFHGPAERRLGDYDPSGAPFLRAVHTVGSAQVYEVVEPGRTVDRAASDARGGKVEP